MKILTTQTKQEREIDRKKIMDMYIDNMFSKEFKGMSKAEQKATYIRDGYTFKSIACVRDMFLFKGTIYSRSIDDYNDVRIEHTDVNIVDRLNYGMGTVYRLHSKMSEDELIKSSLIALNDKLKKEKKNRQALVGRIEAFNKSVLLSEKTIMGLEKTIQELKDKR